VQPSFDLGIEQPAVRIQIFHSPPRSAMLETQSEVIHFFIGFKVMANG